ncbi:MAG: metal-dependent hydrolase [Bacillota bacterium]|nr:metal-dependent hydrolase [Bacillota bacterium]
MNGTQHMTIGAATGWIVSRTIPHDMPTTLLLVGLGAVTGLLPDIDVDGKLSNKITFSHKVIRSVAQAIGLLMIVYSLLVGVGTAKFQGIGIGVGMMIVSSFLTQRRMLTVTGIGVLAVGISLHQSWLTLLGVYIIIASFIPHRSYTHSIAGVIFFSVIAKQFQTSCGINGAFTVCMAGYISHLIADMKILPFNKRGVKFFLPLWKKEF